jgi:integrase
MREELVSRNVARLVTLPPAPARDRRPWPVDETRRFLQAARRDPLYAAFTFLLAYGLRRGEVLGLSWDDVNFDQGVIHIRRRVVRAGGRLHLGPVKTTAGVRELPLLEIAKCALIEHEAKQLLGKPVNEWGRERPIFTTASGRPVEPRNIGRSFERIIRKAGLRPIRLHDLRHTAASLLKRLGVSPRDAMVILGHSNVSVTLGIDTHGDEASRRDALDRLDQALRMVPCPAPDSPADTLAAVTSAVTQADPRAREDQGWL